MQGRGPAVRCEPLDSKFNRALRKRRAERILGEWKHSKVGETSEKGPDEKESLQKGKGVDRLKDRG